VRSESRFHRRAAGGRFCPNHFRSVSVRESWQNVSSRASRARSRTARCSCSLMARSSSSVLAASSCARLTAKPRRRQDGLNRSVSLVRRLPPCPIAKCPHLRHPLLAGLVCLIRSVTGSENGLTRLEGVKENSKSVTYSERSKSRWDRSRFAGCPATARQLFTSASSFPTMSDVFRRTSIESNHAQWSPAHCH
jgi:hypothetical protein